MLSRKATSVLLVAYAILLALCMIGWGALAGLSRDGAMSTIVHRYIMLALVTVTCCTVAATLQLATVRILRALLESGYDDGYASGYTAGVEARPGAAPVSPAVRGLVRSPR